MSDFKIRELFEIINKVPKAVGPLYTVGGDFSGEEARGGLKKEVERELKKLSKDGRKNVISSFGYIMGILKTLDKSEVGKVSSKLYEQVKQAGMFS
jgi:hypothetical protein